MLVLRSTVLLCAAIHTWLLTTGYAELTSQVKLVADVVKQITDGISVQFYQNYLNANGNFSDEDIDGASVADEVAQDVREKFEERYTIVRDLTKSVQTSYDSFYMESDQPYKRCCDMNYLTDEYFNVYIKNRVDWAQLCYSRSPHSNKTDNRYVSTEVFEALRNIHLEKPDLHIQSQLFGDTKGLYFKYPASQIGKSCDTYDPRLRPWFATAISTKTVMLIVLDVSVDMKDCQLMDADSCLTHMADMIDGFLNALNSNDKIGFITFDQFHHFPLLIGGEKCYEKEPYAAVKNNREKLVSYIKNRINYNTVYKSVYSAGLKGAKEFLGVYPPQDATYKVIFITAVDNSEAITTNITSVINELKALVEELVMLTFFFGKTKIIHATDHLKAMKVITGKGVFIPITKIIQIQEHFGTYHTAGVKKSIDVKPVATLPYRDIHSQIVLMTICMPVFKDEVLLGVAGVDLALSDLLSKAIHFRRSKSYAFVIDMTGSILLHQMLTESSNETSAVRDDLKIESVESHEELKPLIEKMKQHRSGDFPIYAPSVISKGDPRQEGVRVVWRNVTYHYRPVTGTEYSVGVVAEDGDSLTYYNIKESMEQEEIKFTYHGRVAYEAVCTYFFTKAITKASVIKLAPRAFLSPSEYLFKKETMKMIDTYERIVKGDSLNTNFTEGVIETIILLSVLDDHWAGQENISFPLASRYIGTELGIICIYPGIELKKNYDPTLRPWYSRAVNSLNSTVVSAPYLDAFGAGIIITISQAVLENKETRRNKPFGVMALDLPAIYFQTKVLDGSKDCGGDFLCFLTDASGYLIAHPIWFDDVWDKNIEFVLHMSQQEGAITNHMLSEQHMNTSECVLVSVFNKTLFYQILDDSADHMDKEPFYEYAKVPNTNVYFFRQNTAKAKEKVKCSCNKEQVCYKTKNCQCPCSKNVDLEPCSGELSSPVPPCLEHPGVAPIIITYEEKQRLDTCYQAPCYQQRNAISCYSHVLCSWCKWGKGGTKIRPFCGKFDECYFGEVDRDSPYEGIKFIKEKPADDSSSCCTPNPLTLFIVLTIVNMNMIL